MTFLEQLQSLDEPTKTKVLIVATAIVMVIVLYFWLAYFNGIVSNAGQPTVADQSQSVPAAPISQGPGFWSRVGNGTAVVGNAIGSGFRAIGNAFESPREYKIK